MRVGMNNWIFIRESEGSPTQGDLLRRINKIDQKDVCKSKLIHGNKDCQRKQKGINNQLDCDCYCVSLLWSEVRGYLHSRPTRRVHRVWTNSTVNQIVFFANQNAYLLYTTTLWTERCLTTLGIFIHWRWTSNVLNVVDVVVVALHEPCLSLCKCDL